MCLQVKIFAIYLFIRIVILSTNGLSRVMRSLVVYFHFNVVLHFIVSYKIALLVIFFSYDTIHAHEYDLGGGNHFRRPPPSSPTTHTHTLTQKVRNNGRATNAL